MNDNSLSKTLSFLDINELIIIFNLNKIILKKFIINLIEKYNVVSKKYGNYKISDYINFIPLPSFLTPLNDNTLIKNYYNDTENLLFLGNICLPHPSISPIPFTYGYMCNNEYRLITTNTYYYEITINEKNNFLDIEKPVISPGFSSIHNVINEQQSGWLNNSIGIHSDDGNIFYNGKSIDRLYKFKCNDTIGCGLIYTNYEKYIPFFTKNGKNLKLLEEIKIEGKITPSVGHDHNNGFTINFGHKNFKYRIKELLKYSNNIISTKNKFINSGYNIKYYKFIKRTILKINNKKYNYHPLKKIKITKKKENISNLLLNYDNKTDTNLIEFSTQFLDNITENLFTPQSSNNLQILGNQINLPGNNNISSTLLSNNTWFNNMINNDIESLISPVSSIQINDPELPNYSDDSLNIDVEETYY